MVLRLIALTAFCGVLMLLGGCSDHNSDAALPDEAHPANFIQLHAAEAAADLQSCSACHGVAFEGVGNAPSCFLCHLDGPPFRIHPANWINVVSAHQNFAEQLNWTTCAATACHGADLGGGLFGPTCFQTIGCHANTGGDPPAPASHVANYPLPANHGPDAKPNQFLCFNCHGRPLNTFDGGFISAPNILNNTDFLGNPVQGSCAGCHPSAQAHPTNWQGGNDSTPAYVSSHRGIDITTQGVSCTLCHNTTGPGPGSFPGAPSCFSSDHTNANNITSVCHPNGPLTAPHPVDGSFRAASTHGVMAKADLTFCQGCHGEAGGPGSSPRFNLPIGNLVNGCEDCHDVGYAHPTNWAGPNTTFHYNSASIQTACTLCHGVALDGVGGVGISCLGCHAETATFALDCAFCHGFPPDGSADLIVTDLGGIGVAHGIVATIGGHDQCATCHGVKNSTTGTSGHLSPNANYSLFDRDNNVNGDHWNGQINMNGPSPTTGVGYNATNFGCDNAACHGNNVAHQLSDSGLTVAFGDYGSGSGGGSAPHPLDGSYLAGSAHGPDAKADLTNCQACHGQNTTTNPRFNIGINAAGGNGCEGCHNNNTAHPAIGGQDNIQWYDINFRHHNAGNMTVACGQCHPGLGGNGTVGPACTFCHVSNPTLATTGCTSCHGTPPNGSTAPNRSRDHNVGAHRLSCTICHTDNGPGSGNHFTRPATAQAYSRANILTVPATTGTITMVMTQGATTTTCTGTCHGENHGSTGRTW